MAASAHSYGWQDDAACIDADRALFFPEREEGTRAYVEARAICAGCGVRTECLADALTHEFGKGPSFRHGMQGGMSPKQRAEYAKTLWRIK